MHKTFSAIVKINEYIAQFSFSTLEELELFIEVTQDAHPHAEIVRTDIPQHYKIA